MKTVIINNLEWQKKDDGVTRNWNEALEYANDLGDGWRLPTIKELISLIDFNSFHSACYIKDCHSSYYWSSSLSAGSSGYAWSVHFYYGGVYGNGKGDHFYARCVRTIEEC